MSGHYYFEHRRSMKHYKQPVSSKQRLNGRRNMTDAPELKALYRKVRGRSVCGGHVISDRPKRICKISWSQPRSMFPESSRGSMRFRTQKREPLTLQGWLQLPVENSPTVSFAKRIPYRRISPPLSKGPRLILSAPMK